MYKNYVFDLYGTLIDINTDEWSVELWDKLALLYSYKGAIYSTAEINRQYNKLCKEEKKKIKEQHPEFTNIDIKIEKVFEKLYNQKGVYPTYDEVLIICSAFRCLSTKYIRLYDGVVDLLETLKRHNKKIYLLSNAQRSFTMGEMIKLDLVKYFDDILISSDIGCSKPDKCFYNALIEKHNMNKKETIMIGNDYRSDINGSKKAGLKSLYIHQSISPEIKGKLNSTYTILDGDVYKIKKLIIKECVSN